jgi:DNA primase
MTFLNKQIKTKQDIKNYIDNLVKNNMLYHFEDDAKDILRSKSGFTEPAFTPEQCILLDARSIEMLKVDYDYTFDYACQVLEELNIL